MKKGLIVLAISLIFSSTLTQAASLQSLNKKQILATFADKTFSTIGLTTLDEKLMSDKIRVYMGKNNELKAKFAEPISNEPQSDEGTFAIKNDGLLCFTWQHWNKSTPSCVYVYKLKNSVIFINSTNNTFESMTLAKTFQSGNQL